MIRVCQKCGTENGAASVHCRNCSVKLPEPTAEMMAPPPSLRRRSFLRAVVWVLILLAVGVAGFWARANLDWRDVQSGAGGLYASCQNVQAAVADAMRRWHSKWLSAEPAPMPAPAPASAPVPAVNKIRCKQCGGLGYTVITEKKTTVDLKKTKHAITEIKKNACLLCDQKGGRTIVLPAGAEICPACYGMGRVVGVFNGREQILPCEICLGKGYVIRKY